jgi:hypothetical protein
MAVDSVAWVMRRALLFGALLAGCVVNPVPEPPSAPELFGRHLHGVPCGPCDGPAVVKGERGATRSAETVSAVNLDTSDAPVFEPVRLDGSFRIVVDALSGDEIRVRALRDDLRSAPVDLLLLPSGLLRPVSRPLASCLVVEPELSFGDRAVGGAASRTLRVAHTCPEPVQVAAIALRASASDFTLDAEAAPITLNAGDFVDLRATFEPSTTGLREDLLIIDIAAPERDRRVVTLVGRGVP